jgi:hypothetical protein
LSKQIKDCRSIFVHYVCIKSNRRCIFWKTKFALEKNNIINKFAVFVSTAKGSYPLNFIGDPELAWSGIGQSTDMVVPYSMLRFLCAVANGGTLIEPHMLLGENAPASVLVKPATAGSVANMFRRLNLELLQLEQTVTLPDGHNILLRQVLYTEYYNHVVTVHLKNGEPYRLRTNHATLEELLTPCGYIHSPSKGILVNFYEVTLCTEDSFTMSDGTVLPISRRKGEEIQSAYAKFQFQKMRAEVDAK